jgi:hypothetical protein
LEKKKLSLTTSQNSEPPKDHRIIGFYGCSRYNHWAQPIAEFGIITVQREVKLPDAVYEMEDLQNTDGQLAVSRRTQN